MDGGPGPGDSHRQRHGHGRPTLEHEQAQERALRDLLAPLLAEFARHRPDDDTT